MIVMTAPTGTGPYTAELYLEGSSTRTAVTTLTEVGTLGQYAQGAFTVDAGGALPDGRYWVRFLNSTGGVVPVTGGNLFVWKDGAELDNTELSDALDTIAALSKLAALRMQCDSVIDTTTSIATFTGKGATAGLVVRKRTRNEEGVLDPVKVFSEELV